MSDASYSDAPPIGNNVDRAEQMTLTDHECHEVKNRRVCVGLLGQAVKRV